MALEAFCAVYAAATLRAPKVLRACPVARSRIVRRTPETIRSIRETRSHAVSLWDVVCGIVVQEDGSRRLPIARPAAAARSRGQQGAFEAQHASLQSGVGL